MVGGGITGYCATSSDVAAHLLSYRFIGIDRVVAILAQALACQGDAPCHLTPPIAALSPALDWSKRHGVVLRHAGGSSDPRMAALGLSTSCCLGHRIRA